MLSLKKPFPGMRPHEKVIIFTRKHWISFLGFLAMAIIMVVVLGVFLVTAYMMLPDFFSAALGPLILISSAYLLFVLGFFLVGWIDFYFDIVIVTDRRIFDIHQRGLFHRDIDELDLLHIEDVSARTKGILQTLFRFGDVSVQTAGTAPNFLFGSIPNPQRLARQIMALYDRVVSMQPERLHRVDSAEGLAPRHIHPPLPTPTPVAPPTSSVPSKFQDQPPQQTDYQKLIKKDQGTFDGEIVEGEDVDFRKGQNNQGQKY